MNGSFRVFTILFYYSHWPWACLEENYQYSWLQYGYRGVLTRSPHAMAPLCICRWSDGASVKEDVLVLGVGNLISALQPPHCFPHMLGLKRWCIAPFLTNIQCCKDKNKPFNCMVAQFKLQGVVQIIRITSYVSSYLVWMFCLSLPLTFLNNFPGKNLGNTRHGNHHILGHWWPSYGLDQLGKKKRHKPSKVVSRT